MRRERNGWTDTGKPVGGQKCPNCGSTTKYRQTVSLEECSGCGLRCDYWGGVTNKIYEDMMSRDAAIEERRRWDEQYRLEQEWRDELDAWNED